MASKFACDTITFNRISLPKQTCDLKSPGVKLLKRDYLYRHEDTQTCLTWRDRKVCENVWPLGETTINLQLVWCQPSDIEMPLCNIQELFQNISEIHLLAVYVLFQRSGLSTPLTSTGSNKRPQFNWHWWAFQRHFYMYFNFERPLFMTNNSLMKRSFPQGCSENFLFLFPSES